MTKTFNLKFLDPETLEALHNLEELTNNSITIYQLITVEVANEKLVKIVEKLLGDAAQIEPSPVMLNTEYLPASPRKFEPRNIGEKACAACGQQLEANAARNAKYCTRTECKHERWRQAARKSAQAKKQPDVAQTLGEEAITLAPDPLAVQ